MTDDSSLYRVRHRHNAGRLIRPIAEVFIDGYRRGALDFGREAWKQCCETCRPKIETIALRYLSDEAA
jgi:hypothetical protein